jgi:hypothetical protein
MFNKWKASKHERKVEFHADAPSAKYDYKYRQRRDIRLAGSVWAESPADRSFRLARSRRFDRMRGGPVGLGFGERDTYGPDNDYGTVESIKQIPDQGYYRENRIQ